MRTRTLLIGVLVALAALAGACDRQEPPPDADRPVTTPSGQEVLRERLDRARTRPAATQPD